MPPWGASRARGNRRGSVATVAHPSSLGPRGLVDKGAVGVPLSSGLGAAQWTGRFVLRGASLGTWGQEAEQPAELGAMLWSGLSPSGWQAREGGTEAACARQRAGAAQGEGPWLRGGRDQTQAPCCPRDAWCHPPALWLHLLAAQLLLEPLRRPLEPGLRGLCLWVLCDRVGGFPPPAPGQGVGSLAVRRPSAPCPL